MQVETNTKPSKKWYLLPIFFSLVGGLIMWGSLKVRDPRMAKKGLVLGIILPLIFYGCVFVVIFVAGLLSTS